jgi:hypothetical protein
MFLEHAYLTMRTLTTCSESATFDSMAPSEQRPRLCYFLTPTRTCPPEGHICLGSIIASPSLVDEPISTRPPPPLDPDSVTTHTERQWKRTVTTAANSGQVGIWTSFLQVFVGASIDAGVAWRNDASQSYSAKSMKWSEFRPSLQYIKTAVADEDVDEFVRANKFREKIYMVTGIMVASGASGVIHSMRERGIYAHAGVDGTLFGGGTAPFALGPEGEYNWGGKESTSFKDSDDFVFAFRLRQIKVKKSGQITSKAKVEGALFGLEDGEQLLRQRALEEEKIGVLVEGLADEDTSGSDFRMEDVDAVDAEGQACLCVAPVED